VENTCYVQQKVTEHASQKDDLGHSSVTRNYKVFLKQGGCRFFYEPANVKYPHYVVAGKARDEVDSLQKNLAEDEELKREYLVGAIQTRTANHGLFWLKKVHLYFFKIENKASG